MSILVSFFDKRFAIGKPVLTSFITMLIISTTQITILPDDIYIQKGYSFE